MNDLMGGLSASCEQRYRFDLINSVRKTCAHACQLTLIRAAICDVLADTRTHTHKQPHITVNGAQTSGAFSRTRAQTHNILLTQMPQHSLLFNHSRARKHTHASTRTHTTGSNCMFVFLYDRLKSHQNHAIKYPIRQRLEFRMRVRMPAPMCYVSSRRCACARVLACLTPTQHHHSTYSSHVHPFAQSMRRLCRGHTGRPRRRQRRHLCVACVFIIIYTHPP